MNINMVNGIMFIIAGLTPFILYLGLGPDGLGFFNQARTEQLFAYLYFSLPIAFLMTRRIESNYFVDSGLLILVASMSMSMVADALKADINFTDMSNAVAVTAYSSSMLGVSVCAIGFFQTNIFPKWLFSTTKHHDDHHRYFKGNYGGYLAIWDHLMGTKI